MTSDDLIHQFRFNQMVLAKLLGGISHEKSLRALVPDGKCINWVAGHILASRADLLAELGFKAHWSQTDAAAYRSGTDGAQIDKAKQIDRLRADLEDSFERILGAIRAMEPKLDKLAKKNSESGQKQTWGQRLGSYICHEAYHAGQIGLMRRLLGKPGLF